MRNKIITLSLLIVSLCGLNLSAVTLADADSAYMAQNYERAISLYNDIIDEEGTSASLLFNLGNAYYQAGDYGHAMLCYQRARRLDPSQEEIASNISYLQSRVDDANKAEQKGKRLKTGADEPSFFQSVHSVVAKERGSDHWALLGATSFILFICCVALYIFSRMVAVRKTGFFGGIIFIGLTVMFLIFAFMGARAYHSESEGVMTAFKSTLLTEPGKNPEEGKGAVLTKGTTVQVLSEETDAEGHVTWYKVRLNSDYIGWVEADALEII